MIQAIPMPTSLTQHEPSSLLPHPDSKPSWSPTIAAPPEFEAIRSQASRIKSFISRHGERSAVIFERGLAASFSEPARFLQHLLSEPPADEVPEACAIIRSLGYAAAALLPYLVATYYGANGLDCHA